MDIALKAVWAVMMIVFFISSITSVRVNTIKLKTEGYDATVARSLAAYCLGASLAVSGIWLPFAESQSYANCWVVGYGILMFVIATIPCGMPFFNRRYVRPLRNLFFLGLGCTLLYMGIAA